MIHSTQLHGQSGGQTEEYLAGWQRARAELDNFRRRMQERGQSDRDSISKDILTTLLPLADNFAAIAQQKPAELAGHAWADGVMHVARQLDQLLADHNILPIEANGHPFDPTLHEAVDSVKGKQADAGQVVEVMQTGYTFHGEVLRPAKVKVAD